MGMILSIGCAVHCAVTPVLLAFAPVIGVSTIGGMAWLSSPLVHQLAAVICCVLMAKALAPRWKQKIDGLTVAFAAVGISFLLTAAFILPDPCCPPNGFLSWIGAPLMTFELLQTWFGGTAAHSIVSAQPYLTPLGGLLLIGAHAMNLDAIRRQDLKAASEACHAHC